MKITKKFILMVSAIMAITLMIVGTVQLNARSKVDLHHGSKGILIKVPIITLRAHARHGDYVHAPSFCNCDF